LLYCCIAVLLYCCIAVSKAPRFRKEQCFLEGSQGLTVCPSGKSKMYRSMSMEHWWNDIDRRNGSTGRKTCPCPTQPGLYTFSPHRAVNTLRLSYKNQPVNAV
jgi:hypothetical protein